MNFARHITCAALLLASGLSFAQSAPAGPAVAANSADANDPSLALRNEKTLEGFEPPLNAPYTLGAGDQISLVFSGHPELDLKSAIGPDGIVTLKYAGDVRLSDLTRDQARDQIVKALAKYYTDLSVTLTIDKYSANKVRVVGFVQHPGEIFFDDTPTLLDAIGRAGLIVPTANVNGAQTNVGSGIPESCTIYRGNDTAVQVDLHKLLMSGSTLADLRLRRNDVVYVPQPEEKFVTVMGEVSKPTNVPLTPRSTLTTVLAEAGCCTEAGGTNPKIHVLARSTGKEYTIDYKKLLTLAGQQEFTLHSGDVVFIQKSGFYKVTWVLQRIAPFATMFSLLYVAGGI
jgi:polysaccharide biosynthesis/export protein